MQLKLGSEKSGFIYGGEIVKKTFETFESKFRIGPSTL